MVTTVFYVGSVTHATRGRHLLERAGFRAVVGRSRHQTADVGCGYTLTVYRDGDKAERILRSGGVPIRNVDRTGLI